MFLIATGSCHNRVAVWPEVSFVGDRSDRCHYSYIFNNKKTYQQEAKHSLTDDFCNKQPGNNGSPFPPARTKRTTSRWVGLRERWWWMDMRISSAWTPCATTVTVSHCFAYYSLVSVIPYVLTLIYL